jgi:diadenosine tetraphosphatase ApaH/serine/threonine PP2A family protein phosphatase
MVGYGPDPAYILDKAAELQRHGAVCLLGNHDEAVFGSARGLNENARTAIEWTRTRLVPGHVAWLKSLPLTFEDEDRLFVHASAADPGKWSYITGPDAAARSLGATRARLTACGHTHIPALYYARPAGAPICFRPLDNRPAPLSAVMRHLVVVGSVGQPRDGNPAACFGLLDTGERTVTMMRVPYDWERTAAKIAERGLPPWLGLRLKIGR